MRWLINYIRQCFCIHELEYDEMHYHVHSEFTDIVKDEYRVSKTCKKCGYHKWYRKFG